MTPHLDRKRIHELAAECGLAVAGVTTPDPFDAERDYIVDHVEAGYLRGFTWYTTERARQSSDPRTLQSDVRSIVSVGVPFWTGNHAPPDDRLRGRIARYAWGRDYHKTLKRRMVRLVEAIEEDAGATVESRKLVDTARAFDRAIAARAGVGWFGKNSMIIVPKHGSWVMLGEIYLNIDIEPDAPLNQDCGRCSFCIDRCPTGAIVEPYRIDSTRCISFLTIEERGPLPRELRHQLGTWVFGCDVCQDVCPYTGAAREFEDTEFQLASVENSYPSLEFLARMTEEEFRQTYSGTAVTRAKRAGMARNAAVALGNSGDERATPILRWMLHNHDATLARGHAAWGLQHLLGDDARPDLDRARHSEQDSYVLEEINIALDAPPPSTTSADVIVKPLTLYTSGRG